MYSGGLPVVVLLACVLTFTSAQLSCKETCGRDFTRGSTCQCDYSCLIYGECCEDYESLCTTEDSCKGRCGEKFKRGRMCSCDTECVKYNQCCPDYKENCEDQDPTPGARDPPTEGNDPEGDNFNPTSYPQDDPDSEIVNLPSAASKQIVESTSGSPPIDLTTEPPLPDLDGFEILPEPTTGSTEATTVLYENETTPGSTTAAPTTTAEPTAPTTNAAETTEETTTLKYEPSAAPETPEPSSTVPTTTSEETTTVQIDTTPAPVEAMPEMSTLATTNAALESTTATGQDVTETNSPTSKPAEKPILVKPFRPLLRPDLKPVLNGLGVDAEYQADDNNDPDLCSGRPISGVTTLSNGTVVVFRGHNFWVLDQNKVPGPARGITQVWGVPSPIDTVFTRCNCQGKTYIFKGPQYWRYENDVLDPGYPKVVQTGFDGLRGHITAALSVPQHNRRKESVYFFKRGGTVQKYSYQFGTNPSCGRKVQYAVYTHPNRRTRQVSAQVSVLGPAINYTSSWKGFPPTITAAVSIPNKREPEGYRYYVFSRSKSYRIKINGERPVVVASKPNPSPHSNDVFKCPKKASRSQ